MSPQSRIPPMKTHVSRSAPVAPGLVVRMNLAMRLAIQSLPVAARSSEKLDGLTPVFATLNIPKTFLIELV